MLLFLTCLSIISAISISVRFEKFNDKLKTALLISAKAMRAIMVEHLAEAGLRYIGLISLTVPADKTENRDARNNHLALPSGTAGSSRSRSRQMLRRKLLITYFTAGSSFVACFFVLFLACPVTRSYICEV